MVETRGAEVIAELLIESLVLSQHDAGDDRSPLAAEPWCERPIEPPPQSVCEPSDPAPMADDAVVKRAKDDVHTLPPQIGSLIESFSLFCTTGATNTGDHLEQRALRRRATARELEARKLVRSLGPEPVHPDRDPHGERATACRTGHLDQRHPGFSGRRS